MIFLVKLEAVLTNIASIDTVTDGQSVAGEEILNQTLVSVVNHLQSRLENQWKGRGVEREEGCNKTILYPHQYEVLQHVDTEPTSSLALGCNHQCRLPAPVSTFYQPVHFISSILTLILSKSLQQCSFIVE